MLYTLDTNAVTAILKNDERVLERVQHVRVDGHDVMLNAISYYEVKRGLVLPRFARKLAVFEALTRARGVLPLDMPALDRAVTIYQELSAEGRLIEDADILVAAIAQARGATLVTHNTQHFVRIPELSLEDWEVGP